MSGAKQKGQVASAMPVRSSNSRCSLSSAPIVIDHILSVLVHQSSAVCELGWRIESHLRHSVRVEDGANCMQQQLKRSVALSFLWAIQD